ncbi:XdhC family protein [Megasphaera hominis]|jgi:xanthine dehydrogenase accessory factor|uniref:XdhC family protein n=1 Tax=Megasphaera hominis TaxID=159836 RepID=A0ABR6VLB4_9FIRM|nr:XdhC/CoxI family protein [Megasphaera hominis]MBC3537893.1 XdhC family protein [Megasphaera hominis]
MHALFARLLTELTEGRAVVLLTILDTKGSTPRTAGSHQLILADGTTVGTVGGGYQEYVACEAGRAALADGTSCLLPLLLHKNPTADIGGVCGGELLVFCQYLAPADAAAIAFFTTLTQCLESHQPSWLALDVTVPDRWAMALQYGTQQVTCEAATAQPGLAACAGTALTAEGIQARQDGVLYEETLVQPRRVIVFGGGHVALALVPLLTGLDFFCTVVDDRSEFANSERFPMADQCIVTDFADLSQHVTVTPDDYVCIMTRGHLGDYEAQKYVLTCHPYYMGVIGSRAKLAFVRNKLKQDGFTEEEINRFHAPIGLPISAATPEEIAVSIAAELIAIRAKREGRQKKGAFIWREETDGSYHISKGTI